MNEYLIAVAGLVAMIVVGVLAMRHLKAADDRKVAADQLADARVQALRHRAAAEDHAGMASVYELRVARLEGLYTLQGDVK